MPKAVKPDSYVLYPKDELSAVLGRRFRAIREARRIGLRPLAKAMGCSFYTIRRHEAGAMPLRTDQLLRAAAALRVRPSRLLIPYRALTVLFKEGYDVEQAGD